MRFRIILGRKKEGDKILLIQTQGEEAVRMIDVARMVVHWYQNEENLYPRPPFRGGQMFLDFLFNCIKTPEDISAVAKRYNLKVPLEVQT